MEILHLGMNLSSHTWDSRASTTDHTLLGRKDGSRGHCDILGYCVVFTILTTALSDEFSSSLFFSPHCPKVKLRHKGSVIRDGSLELSLGPRMADSLWLHCFPIKFNRRFMGQEYFADSRQPLKEVPHPRGALPYPCCIIALVRAHSVRALWPCPTLFMGPH